MTLTLFTAAGCDESLTYLHRTPRIEGLVFDLYKRGLLVRGPTGVGEVAGAPGEEAAAAAGWWSGRVGPEYRVVRSHVPVDQVLG
jgi:hypothetical protein